MQSNFGFNKLMHLGQNKGKYSGWNLPKIEIFKIYFDRHLNSTYFFDEKTSFASILELKLMD